MKRILPILIVGILICTAFGASALHTDMKTLSSNNQGNRDFTHTVFTEWASTSSCPHCPYVHTALKNIYYAGWYPFFYVSLAYGHDKHAEARAGELGVYYVPDTFFDGGYQVYCGSVNDNVQQTMSQFNTSITQCGNRAVPDIYTTVNVNWLGDATMSIQVSVQNNDTTQYSGHIRVFVTEINSTMGWYDAQHHPYTFAFLDYAFNEPISIESSSTWSDEITWDGHNYNDGYGHNFSSIQNDNIMIVAAVYNATGYLAYSDAPYSYQHPFTAYYVDDATGATPSSNNNNPPNKPAPPTGPTNGATDVQYNYTGNTTDSDGDTIQYMFDWGDGSNSGWLGPYPSGAVVQSQHAWKFGGTYNVKLKAFDGIAESQWSNPLVVQITDAGPNIELKNLKGGLFKVSAEIHNTGDVAVSNVNWNITLQGGAFIGKKTEGTNLTIPANSSVTIKSGFILGFGSTIIKAEAWVPTGPSVMIQGNGTIFFVFIKVKS